MKEAIKNGKIEENYFLRLVYFAIGACCLTIAMLGLIFPFIPGILFVIVSAFFFARSSNRFLRFLLHNRFFGRYMHDYLHGDGLPTHVKIVIACTLLISLAFGFYAFH